MKAPRVVITGAGLYSSLGSLKETYAAVKARRANFRLTAPPDPQWIAACPLTAEQARGQGLLVKTRALAFARLAFADCLASARMDRAFIAAHSEQIGIACGQLSSNLSYIWECAERARRGSIDRFAMMNVLTNVVQGSIALEYGLGGVNITAGTSCAASLSALGEALHALRRGEARAVFVGGSEEAQNPLTLGFARRLGVGASAANERACAPFDAGRTGLALGEGAGWLLLETLDSARERGVPPIAEVAGFGSSCGGKHLAAPEEDGRAGFAAMARALRDHLSQGGEVEREASLAFNAHATGTRVGDASEAAAILAFAQLFADPSRLAAGHSLRQVFDALAAASPPSPVTVSALKGNLGHMFSAASVAEIALGALALRDQLALPLRALTATDLPRADCFRFPAAATPLRHDYLVKNSFGFGGVNASLLLRRAGA